MCPRRKLERRGVFPAVAAGLCLWAGGFAAALAEDALREPEIRAFPGIVLFSGQMKGYGEEEVAAMQEELAAWGIASLRDDAVPPEPAGDCPLVAHEIAEAQEARTIALHIRFEPDGEPACREIGVSGEENGKEAAMDALAVFLATATPAGEAADPDYGAYLAQECGTCHNDGATGKVPPIDDLPPGYLRQALAEYDTGFRENAAMRSVARSLDTEQRAALAAHYLKARAEDR